MSCLADGREQIAARRPARPAPAGAKGGSRRSGRGSWAMRHQRRQAQRAGRLVDVLVVDLQLLLAAAGGCARGCRRRSPAARRRRSGGGAPRGRRSTAGPGASSSISRSMSRVTRKGKQPSSSMPGNRSSRLAAISCSSGRNSWPPSARAACGPPASAVQRDEAGQALGHLDPGELALLGLGIARLHRQRQRQVGDEGERVAGIDRQRRQHREHRPPVVLAGELAGLGVQRLPVADVDAVRLASAGSRSS